MVFLNNLKSDVLNRRENQQETNGNLYTFIIKANKVSTVRYFPYSVFECRFDKYGLIIKYIY